MNTRRPDGWRTFLRIPKMYPLVDGSDQGPDAGTAASALTSLDWHEALRGFDVTL